MSDDRKPNIEELYAVAISSGTGFERLVLAAGLQREIVGAMLLRLRAEYDQVRGDLERTGQIAPRRVEEQLKLRQRAANLKRIGENDAAAELLTRAAAIEQRTPGEVKSARAFILLGLSTRDAALAALHTLAVRWAANPKREIDNATAIRLAQRVLDVWLDETCHACDGTGVIGNRYAGDHERQCPTCKGTGHRRDITGANQRERQFAAELFAEVQRQVAAAAAGIKAAIYGEEEAKPANPEFQRRLDELRSAQAAAD